MTERAEELAARIRPIIGVGPGITEKKMFGGAGFMLNGNMIVGAMSTGELLARIDRAQHETAKRRPGAHAMVQGGREMVGFILVDGDGIETDDDLADWIEFCAAYVRTLPPKAAKKAAAKKKAATTPEAKKAPAKKKA